MKIKSIVNFSNIKEKEIYEDSSPEYKALSKIEEEGNWEEYINEMLGNGITIIYDVTMDAFIVKPLNFPKEKIKESMDHSLLFNKVKENLFFEGYKFKKNDDFYIRKFIQESLKTKGKLNECMNNESLTEEFESFKDDNDSETPLEEESRSRQMVRRGRLRVNEMEEPADDDIFESDSYNDLSEDEDEDFEMEPSKKGVNKADKKELLLDDEDMEENNSIEEEISQKDVCSTEEASEIIEGLTNLLVFDFHFSRPEVDEIIENNRDFVIDSICDGISTDVIADKLASFETQDIQEAVKKEKKFKPYKGYKTNDIDDDDEDEKPKSKKSIKKADKKKKNLKEVFGVEDKRPNTSGFHSSLHEAEGDEEEIDEEEDDDLDLETPSDDLAQVKNPKEEIGDEEDLDEPDTEDFDEEVEDEEEYADQDFNKYESEDEAEDWDEVEEVDDEFSIEDTEDEESIEPESEEEFETENDSNLFTIDNLKAIVEDILNKKGSTNTTGSANGFSKQPRLTDALASQEAGVVEDNKKIPMDITTKSDFEEVQGSISKAQNKIDTEKSYKDILEGNEEEIHQELSLNEDQYDDDEFTDEESIMDEDGFIDTGSEEEEFTDAEMGDEEEPIFTPGKTSLKGGLGSGGRDSIEQINTVEHKGQPIKVCITGWMLQEAEIKHLAKSIENSNGQLKKLASNNKKELNLFVEKNNRSFKINYQDKSKTETLAPWSIGENKFSSLNEAVNFGGSNKTNTSKDRIFKKLIVESDIIKRNVTGYNSDSNFFNVGDKDLRDNYNRTWSVKRAGNVSLKNGLNEVFSNITQIQTKVPNTLVKSKDGQYLLFKGNLKENVKIGDKAILVEYATKNNLGEYQIVGLFENNNKGLGRIMEVVKKTALPLYIWK